MAAATLVLPDGRPVAVTGSDDATVRVWDLNTGTPIGDPLTGHTRTVMAAATLVLPDGRPIAVTGSLDATVRVWDLERIDRMGYPLHVASDVTSIAVVAARGGVQVLVGGSGVLARVDLRVDRL
jgi:WD40 repeat protein